MRRTESGGRVTRNDRPGADGGGPLAARGIVESDDGLLESFATHEAALEAGAAVQAADAADAVARALRLLSDDAERSRMGAAGRDLCDAHRGATREHLRLCAGLLAPPATAPARG